MTPLLQIDPRDPTPLYAQLERGIRVAVATGRLTPGDQLPTVRQLAVDLRVNANTVAKVYLALERDGVLVTKRGVGTFIAEGKLKGDHAGERRRQMKALADRFLTDATSLGFTPGEVVEHLKERLAKGDRK